MKISQSNDTLKLKILKHTRGDGAYYFELMQLNERTDEWFSMARCQDLDDAINYADALMKQEIIKTEVIKVYGEYDDEQ